MSRQIQHTVAIQILGNDYQVACPPEEEKALRASAEYLDKQMRQIREKGKIIGTERIAVMAALNLAHELMQSKAQADDHIGASSAEAVQRMNNKLDGALNRLKQLKI